MTKQLPGGDTRPWYVQFWPWFLITLPACVVVAGLATVYIAYRHADDLVADDYYKNGLAINRQLEKKQRASERGISAQLKFSGQTVTVTITGVVGNDDLLLLLSHPLEADRDFTTTVAQVRPGLYAGRLDQAITARWYWTLENQQANGWRLDGAVTASETGNALTH